MLSLIKKLIPLSLLILMLTSCSTSSTQVLRIPKQQPLKQHELHKLACGPCAIIHAFRYASEDWSTSGFDKKSYLQQADYITHTLGSTPSTSHTGKTKWNPQRGMSILDLTAIANTLSPRSIIAFPPPSALSAQHKILSKSLKKGFPPIISIKQQIHKKFRSQKGYYWIATKGHFVTIIRLSPNIDTENQEFWFDYLDSFDGLIHRASISTASQEPLLTTSPLTRKPITWKASGSPAHMPDLKISMKDLPSRGKLTTEIDHFIIGK